MKEAKLSGSLMPSHPSFVHPGSNQGEVSNPPKKVKVTFWKQMTVTS